MLNTILLFFITSVVMVDLPGWLAKGLLNFQHPYMTYGLVAYHAIGFVVLYNRVDLTKLNVANDWVKCLKLIAGWPIFKDVVEKRKNG